MNIFNKFLNMFKLENIEEMDYKQKISSGELAPDEQTIYFKNGKLYKVYPTDKESWYDARYLVSDGAIYDLENVEDLERIPVPNFELYDMMEGYGVTGSLDYVLRMKAGNLYNRKEKKLCSACLWKSTEMMLANNIIGWKKEDYSRLIYWHYELGMFDEAQKAKEYLLSCHIYTENSFDITAKRIKDNVLEKSRQFETDLVVFHDYGNGCCSECAKMRGRVYSISGKSRIYPKLPKYVIQNGNFHPGCRCIMSSFFENEKEIFYKGERVNAKKASTRPWIDDRDEREKKLYDDYLARVEESRVQAQRREEYSIKKGIAQKEFDTIKIYLPELAPKSITGYIRMKNSRSKNFMKIVEEARKKGIEISTD